MNKIEIGLIAGTNQPVGEIMRMRAAAFAGNGVDRFNAVRTHFVKTFGRHRDDFVFTDARLQRLENILIHAITHRCCGVEQRDFVVTLDLARIKHDLLPVHDLQAEFLQRKEERRLDDVNADRHVGDTFLLQDVVNLFRRLLKQADFRRHRAAQSGQARNAVVGGQPRRIEFVMAHRGAEIPDPGFAVAGQQAPACQLVACPFADHRARDVAHVDLVEHQQRTEFGFRQCVARARESVFVQTTEINALFEINLHAAGRLQRTLPAMPRIRRVVQTVGRRRDTLFRINARGLDLHRFHRFGFTRH